MANDTSSGSGYGSDSGHSDNNGAASDGSSTTDPGTADNSDESTNPTFNGAGSWYYFSYDTALEFELAAQQYADGDFINYIPATFWYPIGYDYPRLDVAEGKPYDALSYFHRTEHDPLFYETLPFAAGYKDGYWDAFFNNAYGQGYTFSPDAWQDKAFDFYGADAVGPYAQWLGAYEQHYTQPTSGVEFNQNFPVKLGQALLQVPELQDKLSDPAYFAQLIALGGVYAGLRTELNQDLPDFGPNGFFSAVAGAKSGADLTAAANQLSQFMDQGGDPLKLTSFQGRLITAAQQVPALQDQMTDPDLIKTLLELGSDYAALAPSDTSSDETEQPGTGNNSSTASGSAGSGTDSGTGMGTPDGNGTGADSTEAGDSTDFSPTDDADTDANSTETDASGDTDSNYNGTDPTSTDSGDGHDTSPSDGSGNDSDLNTQGEENNLIAPDNAAPDNKEKSLPPNGDNDPPDYTVKVVDGGIQFIDQYGHVYRNTTFTPQMRLFAKDTSGNQTPIIILRDGQILQIPAGTVLNRTVVQDGDSIYFPISKEAVSPVSLTHTTQPQPLISKLTPVITGLLNFFKPLGEFIAGAVYQWLHDIGAPTRWLLKLLNPYEGEADEDVEQALKNASTDFKLGRVAGDGAGIVSGILEFLGGSASDLGGGLFCLTGPGCIAGAPAVAAGIALQAIGGGTVIKSASSLTDHLLALFSKSRATGDENAEPEITWTNYGNKHTPPPRVEWKYIIKSTKKGPAKYKPGVDIEKLEKLVFKEGTVVTNGKPWKVMEFENVIGASAGKESKWVRVELSAKTIHGHPITYQGKRIMSINRADSR